MPCACSVPPPNAVIPKFMMNPRPSTATTDSGFTITRLTFRGQDSWNEFEPHPTKEGGGDQPTAGARPRSRFDLHGPLALELVVGAHSGHTLGAYARHIHTGRNMINAGQWRARSDHPAQGQSANWATVGWAEPIRPARAMARRCVIADSSTPVRQLRRTAEAAPSGLSHHPCADLASQRGRRLNLGRVAELAG